MYYLWNNLDKIYQVRTEYSVCTWTWKDNWRGTGGLQGCWNCRLGSLSPQCTHRPEPLCVLLGLKRTCNVGVIIFPMDEEELTSSCYFSECFCYHVLFLWKRRYLFTLVHYKEWRFLAPFESSCIQGRVKMGLLQIFFFLPQLKHRCYKSPFGNLFLALLTTKCRELKVNFMEIINARGL